MNYQALVREFHLRFGHPVNDVPTLVPEANELRVALIREELDELKAGIAKGDRVEIADACADLLYVIYGAGVVYGVTIEADTEYGYDEDSVCWLENWLDNLSVYLSGNDIGKLHGCMGMMVDDVFSVANGFDIPIQSCFEEVHHSNMSKAWTAAECIQIMDKLEGGELFVTEWETPIDGRKYVIKNAVGKVLKSPSYSPADIAGILNRQEVGA